MNLQSFSPIPGLSNYKINQDGLIFCIQDPHNPYQIKLRNFKTKDIVCVKNDQNLWREYQVIELLALAFIPIPEGLENPFAIHKDGNTKNSVLSNIEWINKVNDPTSSYLRELRHSKPITIMNVLTREITTFTSLKHCAKFFGTAIAGRLLKSLDGEITQSYKGHYLKFSDNPAPWPDENFIPKVRKSLRCIIVTDVATGISKEHKTISSVARKIGCNGASIIYHLKKRPTEPYRGYLMQYKHNPN